MPKSNEKSAYETHDYSAVETYIRTQNEHREAVNQAIIKSASANRLKYVALVIASCGFAALLILYGLSLLNEEKIITVEKKIITEQPNYVGDANYGFPLLNEEKIITVKKKIITEQPNYVGDGNNVTDSWVPGASLIGNEESSILTQLKEIVGTEMGNEESSILTQLKELEETDKKSSKREDFLSVPLQEKPDSKNKISVDGNDVSTTFTILKTVPSHIPGLNDVITSHRYPNSKTINPESQYCYVVNKFYGHSDLSMNLGSKKGRGSINWDSYNWVFSSHGISRSQFEAAKKQCRFYSPDSKNKKSVDDNDASTIFTIFKTVPSNIPGLNDVISSYRYPNSKTKYPESQYCNAVIKYSGLSDLRMNLGTKKGHGFINWGSYNWVFSSHGISRSQFEATKKKCRFLDWGNLYVE